MKSISPVKWIKPTGVVAFVSCLFILSCRESTPPVKGFAAMPYFDLKGYFQNEAERLSKAPFKFRKVVHVNDKREEKKVEINDFKRELALFSDADINRAAWTDKYRIDSVFNDKKMLTQIVYTALDDKLKTRKISVYFKEGISIQKLFVENSTKSAVATTYQKLTYEPDKGYSIESHQKVALSRDNSFVTEVFFLPRD